MARLLLLVLCACGLARGVAALPLPATQLSPDEVELWRTNVVALEEILLTHHLDVDLRGHRTEITNAAEQLYAQVPKLDRHEVMVSMAALVGLLRDGHSNLVWPREELGVYPFRGYSFSDGYYILDAKPPHEDLIGKRLSRIGGMDVERAFELLFPMVSAENEHFARWLLNGRLNLAAPLHARKVLQDRDHGSFSVQDTAGVEVTHELEAISSADYAAWSQGRDRTVWKARAADSKWYSFRLLKSQRTLYVDFTSCRDQPGEETVLEFVDRLEDFCDRNEFERFVLDLRVNGGGSANNTVPVVRLIAKNPRINRDGRLFTLVSANTYSAAALMCGMLENQTKTLFVGEPAGEGVNLFGDATLHPLPHFGIRVTTSERWWQCSIPEDERPWISIDIQAPRSYADFRNGRDPGLEAIHAFEYAAPQLVPMTPSEVASYVGRYRFSPWQELLIVRKGDGIALRIHDLIDGPAWLAEVTSDLHPSAGRFLTDIRDVFMVRPTPGAEAIPSLSFDWRGVRKHCGRLDPSYRFSVELADGGNIAGGLMGPDFPRGPRDSARGVDASRVVEGLLGLEARPELYRLRFLLEQRLNIAGYRFLTDDQTELAVRIFETNTALYPGSWNAHDSLGEGLFARGGSRDLERALECYERAFAIEPENENGRRVVERIKHALDN